MPRDKAYLQDIVSAGERVTTKIKGVSPEQFIADDDLQDIILRQITIMGEAARLVSEATKQRFSLIPWHRISGMRNRLVHEYRDVDLEAVWKTASDDIPPLITDLRTALANL